MNGFPVLDLVGEVGDLLPGDVRRMDRDHVDLPGDLLRDRGEEVAGRKRRAQPELPRVLAREADRLLRKVGGVDLCPRHLVGNREGDRARAGGEVDVSRRRPFSKSSDRLFRQELRGVSRHEDARCRDQLEAAELGVALDERDRLAGRAPVDQRLVPGRLLFRDLASRQRKVAHHVGQKVFGFDAFPAFLPVIDGGRRLERLDRLVQKRSRIHGRPS